MGHTLTWTVDDGRLMHPRVTCTEPPDADCHLTSDCDCEEWSIRRDEAGAYHSPHGEEEVVVPSILQPGLTLGVPVKHRMTPDPNHCNVRDWIENSDEIELDATASFDVVVPFEPVWAGDFYQWKPLVREVEGVRDA